MAFLATNKPTFLPRKIFCEFSNSLKFTLLFLFPAMTLSVFLVVNDNADLIRSITVKEMFQLKIIQKIPDKNAECSMFLHSLLPSVATSVHCYPSPSPNRTLTK